MAVGAAETLRMVRERMLRMVNFIVTVMEAVDWK